MKLHLFSVIIPAILIVAGIISIFLNFSYGYFAIGAGVIWLIISFLIDYKEDESQPLGMGRGRER
ncbi:MAG: hypothetical protein IT280_09045 [Ignavibacteria bacterium]|nr:hypothetical protein [Ignavibacteria bacterium]